MRKIKFKKSLNVLLYVFVLLLVVGLGYAAVTDLDGIRLKATGDETYQLEVQNSSGTQVFSVDSRGNTYVSGTLTAAAARSIPLPIMSFVVQETASTVSILTATTTTTPAHVNISNNVPVIKLGYGYTTPVSITFRVPNDYLSGGGFRLMANQSGTTTACTVDFDVYVNAAGSTMDGSATNQTPVTLTYAGTTPSLVQLSPATDFAALAAGDWVTLRIWRGATTGTDALQVGDVSFFYTASQ